MEKEEPYLTDFQAVQFLRERGVPVSDSTFRDRRSRGNAPQSVIINGRRLTKKSWLVEWINGQGSQTGRKRGPAAAAVQA